MLVLRASGTVLGDSGPSVRPHGVAPVAEVNHGFDSEGMAFFHRADGFVVAVMRHVWRAVEQRVDAVATICLDDGAVVSNSVTGDDVADVAITCAGFDAIDASPQALQGNLEQMLRFFVNVLGLAHEHGFVQVAVVSENVRGDVDIDDVALL